MTQGAATQNNTFILPYDFMSQNRPVYAPQRYRAIVNDLQVQRTFTTLVQGKLLVSQAQRREHNYQINEIKKGFLVFGCVVVLLTALVAMIMLPFAAITALTIALSLISITFPLGALPLIYFTYMAFDSQATSNIEINTLRTQEYQTSIATDNLRASIIHVGGPNLGQEAFMFFDNLANRDAEFRQHGYVN